MSDTPSPTFIPAPPDLHPFAARVLQSLQSLPFSPEGQSPDAIWSAVNVHFPPNSRSYLSAILIALFQLQELGLVREVPAPAAAHWLSYYTPVLE